MSQLTIDKVSGYVLWHPKKIKPKTFSIKSSRVTSYGAKASYSSVINKIITKANTTIADRLYFFTVNTDSVFGYNAVGLKPTVYDYDWTKRNKSCPRNMQIVAR